MSTKEYVCANHPAEEALFYCDDCTKFIGTKCFALEHRKCNCSTPELMQESLGKEMDTMINDLKLLKSQVDDKMTAITELDNFFTSKNQEAKNSMVAFNQAISSEMTKKTKEINGEIEHIFNGIDSEVENSSQEYIINNVKSFFKKIKK